MVINKTLQMILKLVSKNYHWNKLTVQCVYLSERFFISKLEMLRKQVSAIDGTIKYLWQLGDGESDTGDRFPAGHHPSLRWRCDLPNR